MANFMPHYCGKNFVPRKDVQLIIFSNYHLFECHGEYNSQFQSRMVDFATAELLNDRFNIICLDADENV